MCGSKSSTQTKTVNYPDYVTSAVQQALGQATQAASTPYQAYPGELTAPLNGIQDAAIAGIAGSVGAANPYLSQAYNMATGLNPVSPTQFSPSAVGQYESPYQSDVVNATLGQMNLLNQQQQQNLVGNAASQHALGGDRVGVAQAQLAGQQAAQEAPTIANLNNQNYLQALNEFNTQQQTGMAATEANNYTNLYGAGELGNLGQLALGTGLQGYGALLGAGTLGQQTQQNLDTAQLQQYLAQQQYPFQTAQFLSGISGGLGSLYTGDTTTTTTQPNNILGSVLGLGLSAAGLGAFGGAGPLSGMFSGIFGGGGGDVPYSAFGTKRGGEIPKRADGGESDDDEEDIDAQEPDYDPDAQEAEGLSPTIGMEGYNPDQTLAAIAGQGLGGQGIMSGTPSQTPAMPSNPLNPNQNSMGLDPLHMLLLQTGAGMMASRSPYLGQELGEGLQKGVAGYQQERQYEQQMEYRRAMSQAATTRAEALSQHYQNADKKPQIITAGPTIQYRFNDGSTVDTGIPTTASMRAKDQREYEQGRLQYENKMADRGDYTPIGTDNSDPAHPKVIMADKHNPNNTITTNAAPKMGAGPGGGGGVFKYKYDAYLGAHPGDTQGALDYAAGHKPMSDGDIDRIAMQQATSQANAMKDNFENQGAYDAYRQSAFQQNRALLHSKGSPAAPNPGGAAHKVGDSMDVPSAFASQPDKFLLNRGNEVWEKRGNKIVMIQ